MERRATACKGGTEAHGETSGGRSTGGDERGRSEVVRAHAGAERCPASRAPASRSKRRDHIKPFNIAGYALLTHLLAERTGLEAGEFIRTGGDCHLCRNHLDQAREQLGRTSGPPPRSRIKRRPDGIDGYPPEDFALLGYAPRPRI